MNLQDIEIVKDLANGNPECRAQIDPSAVRQATIETLNAAIALLELAYLQTYLEGKLHCDNFHEGKRSFKDLGESYGYMNSFVRQDGGTNCFRFAYRRPTGNGYVIRENIRMGKNGYTPNAFKRAGHDYELELCLMTEEHYSRLRDGGKLIRAVIANLKKHPLLKNRQAE